MASPRPMQLEAEHLAGVSERFVAGRQIAARVSFPSLVHIGPDRLEVGFGNVANLLFRAGDRKRGRLVVEQRALGLRRGLAARGLGVELLVERDVGVIDLVLARARVGGCREKRERGGAERYRVSNGHVYPRVSRTI